MADQETNAANRMFGLNEPAPRRTETVAQPAAPPAQAQTTSAPPAAPASQPQYIYVQGPPPGLAPASSSGSKILLALVVLLVLLGGLNLYLVLTARQQLNQTTGKQADELNLLTRRMDAGDERYAQLKGQFEVTSEKLGLTEQELGRARSLAANIEKQQQAAVQKLDQQIAQKASAEELSKAQAEANAKFGAVSGDITDINKKLGETNDALSGAKGELSGAIARTHDELVELAHKTDRDYFEFNLANKGAKQKVGTVTVELSKTNTKRNLYTMNLYFDDKRTVRKDQAIDSPVFFYVQGAPSALELVVNKIGRDSIAGYVSAPKGFFSGVPNVLTARPGA